MISFIHFLMKKLAIGSLAAIMLSLSLTACMNNPAAEKNTPKESQDVGINVKVGGPAVHENEDVGMNIEVKKK